MFNKMSPFMDAFKPRHITSRRKRARLAKEEEAKQVKFLSWMPRFGSWIKSSRLPPVDENHTFFPCPQITFLVGDVPKLTCCICQDSQLVFQESNAPGCVGKNGAYRDQVPFITPCGHIVGARCMNTWLRNHSTCPSCRTDLVYSGCGHKVMPKIVSSDGIHNIPATVPDGGHIPSLCRDCFAAELLADLRPEYEARKTVLEICMADFSNNPEPEDAERLARAKDDFQSFLLNTCHPRVALRDVLEW